MVPQPESEAALAHGRRFASIIQTDRERDDDENPSDYLRQCENQECIQFKTKQFKTRS